MLRRVRLRAEEEGDAPPREEERDEADEHPALRLSVDGERGAEEEQPGGRQAEEGRGDDDGSEEPARGPRARSPRG